MDIAMMLLTLVLVGVTGWYAFLTHRLAQSSDRAARAAEASAASAAVASQAASETLGVQRSQVVPQFQTDPVGAAAVGDDGADVVLSGVLLRITNATYVIVHEVQLVELACWSVPQLPVQCVVAQVEFPQRVPTWGGWMLKFADHEDGLPGCGRSDWYSLAVVWSFSAEGEKSLSRVEYRPEGW